jgi:outer membrane protein
MYLNRTLGAVFALCAVATAVPARDLVQVFDDALKNDPQIRAAHANLLAQRESRPQALAALLPQLEGTAAITQDRMTSQQDTVAMNANNESIVVPQTTSFSTRTQQWSITLQQSVFSWANLMSLRAASRVVAQAEVAYQAAEQNLCLRVAQAYFNVLAAQDGLAAQQASLEAISRQLEQARQRFEVGQVAITDVQEAQAAHDTAAAAVIAAKRTLATTEDQLQEITHQRYDSLAKPGTEMPLLMPQPADEKSWVAASLDQNLDLLSTQLAADIARDNVKVAFAGHLPTLSLVASNTSSNATMDETLTSQGMSQSFANLANNNRDRQVSLQLTVPLFTGGLTQSRVRQSQYLWLAAKEQVIQASRATERQARDAYLGVISGIARVKALRQALESSKTALQATEAGYELGARTAVDVLNSRRILVQAQTDYSGSRYDYILSLIQLRLAAGTLNLARLAEINRWLVAAVASSPAERTPQSLAPETPSPGARAPTTPR